MPLCNHYNHCTSNIYWPKEWKKSEWVPVHKKDDLSNKENCRPVTVQIIIHKIFEKLLANQITASINHRMSEYLTMLTEKWRCALNNRESVDVLSTDISKAFDCLHPPLLLAKLKTYGFESDSLNLIKSYFTDRYNKVKLDDVVSSW